MFSKGFWNFNPLILIPLIVGVLTVFGLLYHCFMNYPLISAIIGTIILLAYVKCLIDFKDYKDNLKRKNK